jgi:serine/threonine protein kinase
MEGAPGVFGSGYGAYADPAHVTREGAVLGTLHYMSPEQVQGKETSAVSDIFSFGAVLYEMLSGRRAFAGENPALVIAAILTAEPPALAESAANPTLDRVLRRCLAKDPEDRWQTARDSSSSSGLPPGPRQPYPTRLVISSSTPRHATPKSWSWLDDRRTLESRFCIALLRLLLAGGELARRERHDSR